MNTHPRYVLAMSAFFVIASITAALVLQLLGIWQPWGSP